MAGRATLVAFIFSLLGAIYQMVSFALAYLINHQFAYYYYIGLYGYFNSLAVLIIFWAMSHLMDKQDSRRTTWPAIILGIGVANLANLIIAWSSPVSGTFSATSQTFPVDIGVTLLPAPLLLVLGGIFGFVGATRASSGGVS